MRDYEGMALTNANRLHCIRGSRETEILAVLAESSAWRECQPGSVKDTCKVLTLVRSKV